MPEQRELRAATAEGVGTVDAESNLLTRNLLTRLARRLVLRQLAGIESLEIEESDRPTVIRHRLGPQLPRSAVLRVRNSRFYRRTLFGGALGAAESYLRGEWETDDLVGLFRSLARDQWALSQLGSSARWLLKPATWIRQVLTRNSLSGSRRNIHAHYDLGNDFFQLFLDNSMTYSSGYFASPQSSLEAASIEKYDRICRRLRLQPGQHVIEIGGGWGGFALHAAKNYGCRVTTTTISSEQFEFACDRFDAARLDGLITLKNEDYRSLTGQYDCLVSIEMIEAVGHRYLPTYFRKCHELLKPGGEMVIQAITIPDQRFETYRRQVDFIQKYIFPGGSLPSLGSIHAAAKQTPDLSLVHLEDFGEHYATTLAMWRRRFWDRIDDVLSLGLDARFVRMWDYYLAYCETGFREQLTGVAQLCFRRGGDATNVAGKGPQHEMKVKHVDFGD